MAPYPPRLLQFFWRVTRGQTLGVQGVILDSEKRILLIRHRYRAGWHFPGGGVERQETCVEALARELREETGCVLTGPPTLFGVYAHFPKFPGDHILVYLVSQWEQPEVPAANLEIAEQNFFPLTGLPEDISPATLRRLEEIFHEAPRSDYW